MTINYLSPILGAIIGYSTNWLAIKMIFRPLEEKKFLGVKVPFTPGVIAKEKERMASKLGNTISNHLITSEEIYKYIKSDETKVLIQNKVSKVLTQNNNNTFGDILFFLENDEITNKIVTSVFDFLDFDDIVNKNSTKIYNMVCNDNVANKINVALEENFDTICDLVINKILDSNFKNMIQEETKTIYNILLENNNTLINYISDEEVDKVREYLQENIQTILLKISKYINSESFDEADKEILTVFTKILESTVGSLVLNFVKPENIYFKGKEKFNQYILDTENQDEILSYIEKFLNFITNTKVSNVTSLVSEENAEIFVNKVTDFVLNNYSQKYVSQILRKIFLENKISKEHIALILNKFGFENFVKENLYIYLEEFKYNFHKSEKIENFKKIPVSTFLKDDKDVLYLSEKISLYILDFTKSNIEGIVNSINISKIVQDKINEMPIEDTEKMVLEVVKKELNLITYLGGVLGFIVGLIPLVIKNI